MFQWDFWPLSAFLFVLSTFDKYDDNMLGAERTRSVRLHRRSLRH